MPYIKQTRRYALDAQEVFPGDPGELNYCITQLIRSYMMGTKMNYQVMNDVLGALEGAKLEFYRRVVAQLEDKKIEENGDVY